MSVQNVPAAGPTPVAVRPPEAPAKGHAAVYRLHSGSGELLYIGSTSNPPQRWSRHKGSKPWWSEVAFYTLEWHTDRATAFAEEYRAIRAEEPRYNVLGVFPFGEAQPISEAAQRVLDALDALEEIDDLQLRAVSFSQVAADLSRRGRLFREQRRQMVLDFRAQGVSYRKIAAQLGVSLRVVQDLELGYAGPGTNRPRRASTA